MIKAFGRYVGVQLVAYVVDMGGFLLASLVVGPIAANVVAKIAAGVFAFFAHRYFTFGAHKYGDGRVQMLKYSLLLLINVPVASLVLSVLLPRISPPVLAKFVSDVICVGGTFLASRFFAFAPSRQAGKP